jgi:hypothetical protein
MISSDRGRKQRIFAGLAAEVTLATLPLLVTLFVLLHLAHFDGFFGSPEWSFGAAILFGQTLAKFAGGLVSAGRAAPGPVSLIIAALIVFGIAPALLVLAVTLQAAEERSHVSAWLEAGQVLLFVASAVLYMLLGAVSERWIDREESTLESDR